MPVEILFELRPQQSSAVAMRSYFEYAALQYRWNSPPVRFYTSFPSKDDKISGPSLGLAWNSWVICNFI